MAYEITGTVQAKTTNTFELLGTNTDNDGKPLSLSGTVVTAKVRNAYRRVVTHMNVKIISDYTFELSLPKGAVLPPGDLYLDVRTEKDGIELNSSVLKIEVLEVVTDE